MFKRNISASPGSGETFRDIHRVCVARRSLFALPSQQLHALLLGGDNADRFLKRSGRLVFQAIPSYHLHYQIMDGIDERTSRGLPFYFDECHCVLGTTVVPEKHGQIDSGDIIHNSSCK